MKIFLSLLMTISIYSVAAQSVSIPYLIPTDYCGGSTGGSENEQKVDSLFSELNKLNDSLSKLEFETTPITLDGCVFLFLSEFTETTQYFEFPQPQHLRSYSRCITDSLMGKKDQWNLFSKDTSSHIVSSKIIAYKYGSTFLTISKTTHYSANNQWWTTQKYYLIKEDEYENFIKP